MDAQGTLRALLRAGNLHAVAEALAKNLPLEDLIAQLQVEGKIVETVVKPIPPPLELREAQQVVIEAARGKGWLTMKALARESGYELIYARKLVAELVRLGVFGRGPDGVRLDESQV